MNPLMLALMVAVGLNNWQHLVGIIVGLAVCYLFFDDKKNSSIVYHMTHWSWTDWRV